MALSILVWFGVLVSQARSIGRQYTEPGIADYQNGNYPKAIQELNTAIRLEPGEPYAHYYLGLSLKKTGDVAGARRQFLGARDKEADSRQPNDAFIDRCNRAINDIDDGH